MKRNLSLFLAVVSVLLILCAAGCGKEEIDWVTGEAYATTGTSSTTRPSVSTEASQSGITGSVGGTYDAPKFLPGKYSMVNASSTLTEYVNEAGTPYYAESTLSQYTYGLDISESGGGFKCVMSFDNILISQTISGTTTVLLDTSIRDYLSADTEPYYDLIGLSFTVNIGADGSVTDVQGVEQLVAQYPNSAMLLDKENLRGVASSFFYPIPGTFTDGTSWVMEQYDLSNVYRVTSLARDRFGISINGPKQQPFSYSTEDGLTLDYSDVSPLTGTLYMDIFNRALQEITSMQKSSGTITGEGVDILFNYNVTSITTVTESK